MTKRAFRAEERRRWIKRAKEDFNKASPRPFEHVPEWLLIEFASDKVRGLDLPTRTAKKAWLVRARAELDHRIESKDKDKRYCLLPWVPKREATPEEKDDIEITLDWLQKHVEVDEETGCWVWKGFITKGDQPQARIVVAPGVSATMLVRRLVAKMKFEPTAKYPSAAAFIRNRQAGVDETCLRGCCHPDHVKVRTKVQAMRRRKGVPLPLEHKMRISAARRKNSRISDEAIKAMLADPRPGNKVAADLGVHPSYVPHVRTGKLRVYSALGGGMFSGLLAPANGEFYDEAETA